METQEYGLEIDAIGVGFSKMAPVTSVKGNGVTYLRGEIRVDINPPGAFTKLGRELPFVNGDLVVTVDERVQKLFGDKVVDAMNRLGWTHVHTQHQTGKISFWFYRFTDESRRNTLYGITGTTFPEGGAQGKVGNKRDRVYSAVNSPDAGAFVCLRPSEWDGPVCSVQLPDGKAVTVLSVDAPHDANDGDALLSVAAVEALAEAAEIKNRNWARLDHVQFQIRTRGRFIKAMGQMAQEWPEEYAGYDIVIGSPGVSDATSTDITVGKVTFHIAPSRDAGFRIADGLETVPNILLKYYEAKTLVGFGKLVALRQLVADQRRVISANRPRAATADYFADDDEEQGSLPSWVRDKRETDVWCPTHDAEENFAALVKGLTGSIFAHPSCLGNAHLAASRVRGALNKAASSRDMSEGMPYAVIPGHYLNRAWRSFACVAEPEYGWANIQFRKDGSPYLFVLNDEQVGDADLHLRDSTPDNDDHWLSTIGRCPETGDFYLIAGRQPNEPDGGYHYRVSFEDARQWAETRPILPLKEGWGHRVPSLVELDNQFELTEVIEPQAPTRDLAEITAYCRWAAQEGKSVAEYANATQALFNSGASVAESYSCSSDLLDNIWLQSYRGQQIVEQVHAAAVEYTAAGRPWHQPTLARIRRAVKELYLEKHGSLPTFRFGHYPELQALYRGIVETDDALDFQAAIVKGMANGPYAMLTSPVSVETAVIAAKAVVAAKQEWTAWGSAKSRTMRSRLPYATKERLVEESTARTLERIRARTLAGYEQAKQTADYVPGHYAQALAQALQSHAPRWEPADSNGGRNRVTKARKQLPKQPYQLIQALPEPELAACYRQDDAYSTGPTWVSRITGLAGEMLHPNEWVEVVKVKTGVYEMRADTTGELMGTLGKEACGMEGMIVQFLGEIPRYERVAAACADFYQSATLAVFQVPGFELRDQINRKRHLLEDAISSKCQLTS